MYLFYYRQEIESQKEQDQKRNTGVNISSGRSIGSIPELGI